MVQEDFYKRIKKNSLALTSELIKSLPQIVRNNKVMYIYNGRCYEFIDKDDFESLLIKFLENNNCIDLWTNKRVSEVKKAYFGWPNFPTVKMDDYKDLLCMRNGILDVNTGNLIKHSPDYYFSSYIDVDYNKEDKDASVFVNFLQGLFTDEKGRVDEKTISNLLRIGGYLLYPKNEMKKFFMFLGEGANGKSVLIDVYKMFFPKKFITAMSLKQLSDEGFARTPLLKSRINVKTEAKGNAVDAEEVKAIVDGELITVHRKFQEPVEFNPNTKIIIASNSMPYFKDTTHAIKRRQFVVEFKNRFVPPEEYKNIKNPQMFRIFMADNYYTLMKKLEKEKTAILNMFLIALHELKKNNWQLIPTLNTIEITQQLQEHSDTFGTFFLENYERTTEKGEMGLEPIEVLDHYRYWYESNVSKRSLNMSVNTVGRRIRELLRVKPTKITADRNGFRTTITLFPIRRKIFDLQKEVGTKEDEETISKLDSKQLAADFSTDENGSGFNENGLPAKPIAKHPFVS